MGENLSQQRAQELLIHRSTDTGSTARAQLRKRIRVRIARQARFTIAFDCLTSIDIFVSIPSLPYSFIPMRYPCTGYIDMHGFGSFLEQETTAPRRNLLAFTAELKEQFNVPYLTLVNSGSSANLVAAMAMAEKLKQLWKPLTAAISAFSFPTTISALVLAGFKVQAMDVEQGGFNISPKSIIEAEEFPSLLVVTHFLGFPCAIQEITEIAHERGSFVLQDACETLGLMVASKPIHAYGDITTWSFYHPHHLSSYGGGAVLTLNRQDHVLTDSIAHWGRACRCHLEGEYCSVPQGPAHQFTYERLGVNVEMSELNACFGRWQLQRWAQIEAARHERYRILHNELADLHGIRIYDAPAEGASAFVFPITLCDGRSIHDVYPILAGEGIEMRTLMGGVSNEQAAFCGSVLSSELLPNAHRMAESTFFVGIHHTLPTDDVRHVATRLRLLLG